MCSQSFAYMKTFWYISGQLVMLPLSIRMCIKSQESKSKPCQGDSISRCEKRRLGGILRLEISKPCLHKSSCRTYFSGCIKERSNPRTSPVGYLLSQILSAKYCFIPKYQPVLWRVLLTRPYQSPKFLYRCPNLRFEALDRSWV